MMWTYRVIRDNNGRFSIREVFHERDGAIISYGQQPYAPVAASLEELKQEIRWLKKAFELPVLPVEAVEAKTRSRLPSQSNAHSKTFSLEEVRARLALEVEKETEPPARAYAGM